MYLCRAELPHLVQRGGNIVNVASIAGVEGHGLIGLTRALAVEYTADRLRVNAICPGGTLTPQIEHLAARETPNYDLILRTASPRGMASGAAAAVHGAVYRVDNRKGAG